MRTSRCTGTRTSFGVHIEVASALQRLYRTLQVRTRPSSSISTSRTLPRRYVPGVVLEEYCINTTSPTQTLRFASIHLRVGNNEAKHWTLYWYYQVASSSSRKDLRMWGSSTSIYSCGGLDWLWPLISMFGVSGIRRSSSGGEERDFCADTGRSFNMLAIRLTAQFNSA